MRWYIALCICLCSTTATLGWLAGVEAGLKTVKQHRQEAYQRGRDSVSLRELIDADHKYTREICKLWWFGMDGLERKLK
jgi:hypothetical protein